MIIDNNPSQRGARKAARSIISIGNRKGIAMTDLDKTSAHMPTITIACNLDEAIAKANAYKALGYTVRLTTPTKPNGLLLLTVEEKS